MSAGFEPTPLPDVEARLGDRALFPELVPWAYLNHSAISPLSSAARVCLEQAAGLTAREGLGGFPPLNAQRKRLKQTLAALIGGQAEDIALVPGTGAALGAIAACMPWKPGDRIILFEGEFPANVTPWLQATKAFGVEPVFLPIADFGRPDGPDFDRLDAALADGARLLAISAVQFQTGLQVPLAEIGRRCRAHGCELAVDAIQAVGAVPIDVDAMGIDYLAAGGHKWLMGPQGAGFAWARPEKAAALVPRVAGWMSHVSPVDFLIAPGMLRYDKPLRTRLDFLEGSAPNGLGYAALEGAVHCIAQIGVAAIFEHIQRWHDAVDGPMVERGFRSRRAPDAARRSGVLTWTPPKDLLAANISLALGRRGVACSTPEGLLRFAPHWPNALGEVPLVLGAVDEALAELRG